MFDVIGDIHGQREALERLLVTLGYQEKKGAWRHPERLAVFVGDLVDRGHDIPGTVRLVRAMHEAGTAHVVMGNHEWNLLAWHERDPQTGEPLRSHTGPRAGQVRGTLDQYAHTGGLGPALDWMRTLPPALVLDGLHVVHATWDPELVAALDRRHRDGGRLDAADMLATSRRDRIDGEAVEVVLKGREGRVPDELVPRDGAGKRRRRVRLRWFDAPQGRTWADYVLHHDLHLPESPLPDAILRDAVPWPTDGPPVVFGHYCLPMATPRRLRANVACVDTGAGRGWRLTAYRWDGEPVFDDAKFVQVPVNRD